ncbi:TetR/AcrR family transcriptional regulator [Nakamurella leprariae]|uniref:TetR/AcrR family transcriptional regulator n=1 Tax=Nakamurella leprariae TaxID=2803911 RepID=A0A939BZ61_9ACTN|nr:TetR/AcrR family transcriptional regulator [Nakamurella leprariae]MBM9467351.1 TetR/AcrR family transcriptional regulator [Nakamurella leprariae]
MTAASAAPGPARSARERARAEITAEILASARAQLAEVGPAALSLRAVARDIGMVSSAVYRYYPSRDDLLTDLLVTAFDELGQAAEDAAHRARARPVAARWLATGRAVRAWALAHPHEWALLYGSPVPGYRAPRTTVGPATRVIAVLVRMARGGALDATPAWVDRRTVRAVASAREHARNWRPDGGTTGSSSDRPESTTAEPADDGSHETAVTVRVMAAWATLFGTISFELFGHLVGSIDDLDQYFDAVCRMTASDLGLT